MYRILNVIMLMLLPVFVLSQYKKSSKSKQGSFSSVPFWAEEFNYRGLPDTTKWNYETGGGGFGNNELEYYTHAKNAFVSNGSYQYRQEKKK